MEYYPLIYFACHTRHVADPDSENSLTSHQSSILDHLNDEVGLRVSDLASHMGVTNSTMSININRLSDMGYVTRERDVEDKRVVRVRLTEEGLRIKLASSVLDPDRVMNVLRKLDAREREKAIEGLRLLASAAQRYMSDDSAD